MNKVVVGQPKRSSCVAASPSDNFFGDRQDSEIRLCFKGIIQESTLNNNKDWERGIILRDF